MADNDKTTRIGIEIILKHSECRDIEIIGWFVKKKHIGRIDKLFEQIESPALTSRKGADITVLG
jgi:hypothetical protein